MDAAIVNNQSLKDIANAIRKKTGETTQYLPSEMATAISNIQTGGGEITQGVSIKSVDEKGVITEAEAIGPLYRCEFYCGTKAYNSSGSVSDTSSNNVFYNAKIKWNSKLQTKIPDLCFSCCKNAFGTDGLNLSKITEIGSESLKGCDIYKIYNDEDVTTIKSYAFYYTNIYCDIKDNFKNVTTIKDYAFYNTVFYNKDSILDLSCMTKVATIPDSCFRSSYLNDVILPQNITTIKDYAFYNMYRPFSSVSIPDCVTYIGSYAFSNSSIINAEITKLPSALTYIGRDAFSGWKGMKITELPIGVTSLTNYGGEFNETSIVELNCPGLVILGCTGSTNGNFSYCNTIKRLTVGSIGHPVQTMNNYIFYNYNNASGKSVEEINVYVADGVISMPNCPWGASTPTLTVNYYSATDGSLVSSVQPNATT